MTFRRFADAAKAERPHPITGDLMGLRDRMSWAAQGLIRRWSFIGGITVVTAVWWLRPDWFGDPTLVHWNALASYMALFIESVVGIGMFGQTMRDALILRRIEKLEAAQQQRTELDLATDLDTNKLVRTIADQLGIDHE